MYLSMTSIWLRSITSVIQLEVFRVRRVAQQPQPFFAEPLDSYTGSCGV